MPDLPLAAGYPNSAFTSSVKADKLYAGRWRINKCAFYSSQQVLESSLLSTGGEDSDQLQTLQRQLMEAQRELEEKGREVEEMKQEEEQNRREEEQLKRELGGEREEKATLQHQVDSLRDKLNVSEVCTLTHP